MNWIKSYQLWEAVRPKGYRNLLQLEEIASLSGNQKRLDELSVHSSPAIRKRVAENPKTSESTLLGLFQQSDEEIQQAALYNPNFPVSGLVLAARHPNVQHRLSAAVDARTPVDSLILLRGEPLESAIHRSIVRWANYGIRRYLDTCSPEERDRVERALNMQDLGIRTSEEEVNLDDLNLEELGESKKFKSGSRLWENLDDAEKEAIETIARHSRDSKKLAQIYQHRPSVNIKWILSRNKEMPSWALSEMSRDQDRRIRVGTAGNPNTPAEDLIRLSKDPDQTVRSKLGDNPKAPVAALDILSRTEEAKGFGDGLGIVSHPNCPPDILLRFINHEYHAVREIARHKIKEHLRQAEPDEINRIKRLESMMDLGIDPTWEEPDLEGLDL